jgi:hypothetical protein
LINVVCTEITEEYEELSYVTERTIKFKRRRLVSGFVRFDRIVPMAEQHATNQHQRMIDRRKKSQLNPKQLLRSS